MSFDLLGLRPELLRAVAQQGYTEPTPVQAQAIPIVLEGRDLLAGAQTGTGKTAAFVLPMLQRLHAMRPQGVRRVRALVVTPTRELALQVEESVRIYGTYLPTRSVAIYGGVGMDKQVRDIRAGAEIVVATPGRLLDHIGQGTVRLSSVEILVLDEADRMLDMGFIHDIRKILALLPTDRQSLLFSATFSPDIRALAERLLRSPASVDVAPRNSAAELVRQVVHPVDKDRKRALLSHLVRSRRIHQALVFTRTKHGANRLAEQLQRDGIDAMAIHGNKSQAARVKALNAFKDGGAQVLVATDIAARGIDIDQLPHVVNYELPNVPEDYVHRIGRTGRAGAGGTAVSLVSADEAVFLRDIERLLHARIDREIIAGYEPDPNAIPEPEPPRASVGRAGQGRGPGRRGLGRCPLAGGGWFGNGAPVAGAAGAGGATARPQPSSGLRPGGPQAGIPAASQGGRGPAVPRDAAARDGTPRTAGPQHGQRHAGDRRPTGLRQVPGTSLGQRPAGSSLGQRPSGGHRPTGAGRPFVASRPHAGPGGVPRSQGAPTSLPSERITVRPPRDQGA